MVSNRAKPLIYGNNCLNILCEICSVLAILGQFQGKEHERIPFLNKFADCQPATLLKGKSLNTFSRKFPKHQNKYFSDNCNVDVFKQKENASWIPGFNYMILLSKEYVKENKSNNEH